MVLDRLKEKIESGDPGSDVLICIIDRYGKPLLVDITDVCLDENGNVEIQCASPLVERRFF